MRKLHLLIAIGLGLFALNLNAQTAFILPGQNGVTPDVTGFSVSPFAQITTLEATTSAYEALARSDGGEYYIISNSAANTVITTNSILGNVQPLIGFGSGAVAAIRTPDGQKILVAAGNLQIINVANDSLLDPSGVDVGGTAVDIAASIDSTRAFVLVNTGAGYQLSAVDLRLFTSVGTLSIAGTPSGVTVGPNGLVYVGTTNALLEIDPTSLAVRNTITVTGTPGKLAFTPNGKLGLAVNQTPVTSFALFIFDLNAKTLSSLSSFFTTTAIPNALSQIFPISDNRAYGYSSSTQTLYTLQFSPQSVSTFLPAAPGSVALAATTNDFANTNATPSGTHSMTRYLLYVSGGILYEYDIQDNQTAGQLSLTGSPGALSIATPANTAGFPAAIFPYGDQQTVALSATSAPLVVRVIDSQGRPVAGVGFTFTTPNADATLQFRNVISNTDGLAGITIAAPATAGPVQVTASAGTSLSYTFTVNVGSSSTGGGGGGTGGTPSGLTIIGGQGALVESGATLSSQTNAATSVQQFMAVQYTDTNGNPIAGATITFSQTSGVGTLQCPSSTTETFFCVQSSSGTLTVKTDSQGIAECDYAAGQVPPSNVSGFSQGTITATPPSGTGVTFYETTFPIGSPPSVGLRAPAFGALLKGSAGQTISNAIQVAATSINGTPIPNASIRIANPPDPTKGPSAQCAGIFGLSDSTGVASCNLVLEGLPGSAMLTAEAGYLFDFSPINISVSAGVASKINIIQGNSQSGNPGQILPNAFVIQVTDASGNPLPQIAVSWKVLSGTITLSQVSTMTDTSGKASAQGTLGNTPGQAQVQVTAGSGSSQISATFSVTINTPPASVAGITIVSGNNQATVVNTPFANPLVVNVTDSNGQPVQNASVTFTVTSGSATVTTANASTGVNGNASTTVTAGGTAGAVVITASIGGFSMTFNLTVSPPGPANVVFLNGASLQPGAAAGAIVTIQGAGIAPSVNGVVVANAILGPLPTSLAGVSVTFNGTLAPIFSVSNVNGVQQVTVQVPWEVAGLATASVVITVNGGGSGTFNVTLQPYSPGIFITNVFGLANQAVAIRPDGSYVSPSNPARRGEDIILFVTGAGQTSPPLGTDDAGIPNQNILANFAVGFNNSGSPSVSAQTVVGLVGVYAITLQVPPDTAPGPNQPVGFIVYDAAGTPYFALAAVIPIQ
ncbi:MAG TPA: hypothetical protein VMH05_12350 [Bryobacteraceae bacterium]|nr:hypothetical protein [Bryobacteraceae bacterium]